MLFDSFIDFLFNSGELGLLDYIYVYDNSLSDYRVFMLECGEASFIVVSQITYLKNVYSGRRIQFVTTVFDGLAIYLFGGAKNDN